MLDQHIEQCCQRAGSVADIEVHVGSADGGEMVVVQHEHDSLGVATTDGCAAIKIK